MNDGDADQRLVQLGIVPRGLAAEVVHCADRFRARETAARGDEGEDPRRIDSSVSMEAASSSATMRLRSSAASARVFMVTAYAPTRGRTKKFVSDPSARSR